MKLPILLIGFALTAAAQNAVDQTPEHPAAARPVTESLASVKRVYVEALAGDHIPEFECLVSTSRQSIARIATPRQAENRPAVRTEFAQTIPSTQVPEPKLAIPAGGQSELLIHTQ